MIQHQETRKCIRNQGYKKIFLAENRIKNKIPAEFAR